MPRSKSRRKRKPATRATAGSHYVVLLSGYDADDEGDDDILTFSDFDEAVECCVALGIPVLSEVRNKTYTLWFVHTDDNGNTVVASNPEGERAFFMAHSDAGPNSDSTVHCSAKKASI